MFPFLDYDIVEVTDLSDLGGYKKLDAFESIFWNYALSINFYPSLSDILKLDMVYELDFKNYVISSINGAFNSQNYKRSSTAYRDMWTALNNPLVLKELKLISDDDFREVMLSFSFESFILNQKYRQLSFWDIDGEQIGFIKHTYSDSVMARYRDTEKSLITLTYNEIEKLLRDSFKFPQGLINIGSMYNNVIQNKPACSKLLSQINLDSLIKDAIFIANSNTYDQTYHRVVCNMFTFVCVCNNIVVSFK